jgi:circadian clock protein KaiB
MHKVECEYILRLFINGTTPASNLALDNLRTILEGELKGKYELDIVDVSKDPKSLREENVVALPTLIKKLPLPVRHIIGNMTNREKVLVGLDLIQKIKS